MILGALAEGFGILMLVPLATVAVGGAGSGPLSSLSGLADRLPPDRRFLIALGLFVAAMTVRSVLVYARDRILSRLQAGYEASLRLRSAATLASRGWTFASRIGQAGMQSLLLIDVPRAANAVAQSQQFTVAAVMLIVQLALAAILSPGLTAVALAIIALWAPFSIRWTRRGVKSGMALVRRSEESAGSGFRLHAALKAALAQGNVPQFLSEYRTSLAGARDQVVHFAADLAASRALAFLASAFAAALLFFVGYGMLALPFPVLVASLVLFARMAGPAQQLQTNAQNIAAYSPSFSAIERRLGRLEAVPAEEAAPKPLEWSELQLDGCAFEHQPDLGLKQASLKLRRGEWLGVGGPSGACKTTLVDLVAGLLVPQSGDVAVDGHKLEGETLERWRAGLAYIGQEGSVFDDSVRGNLTADSGGASDEQLWQALELVGLAGRIRAFAGGLDERVGDRGSSLSGGERQRLVIARALMRQPRLLLLDEATAALDTDGEAALLERLRALDPRPAAILVAHRESTLAYCDSVVAIQHGVLE
ncbi:MAG TPA: ABC transporter ATP-binding protein [Sphingomicrobium sp.]|nr:ABC transporter ATP-binding protein [Sphingomicrobium sp.]